MRFFLETNHTNLQGADLMLFGKLQASRRNPAWTGAEPAGGSQTFHEFVVELG